jgi:hypothetical protein
MTVTDRRRGRPTETRQQLSDRKYHLVTNSRVNLTPRRTVWLTVGRNMTLTLTLSALLVGGVSKIETINYDHEFCES